jgi:hypothetical protein
MKTAPWWSTLKAKTGCSASSSPSKIHPQNSSNPRQELQPLMRNGDGHFSQSKCMTLPDELVTAELGSVVRPLLGQGRAVLATLGDDDPRRLVHNEFPRQATEGPLLGG